MPWTAGGTPVTIERLLGLVKLGMTQSAITARAPRQHPLHPRHVAAGDRLGDVVRLAAVDAHHHRGVLGQPVAASV